jgi:ABC-type nitrate/sulfonate/bicarbonate transport system substrate-binding protein
MMKHLGHPKRLKASRRRFLALMAGAGSVLASPRILRARGLASVKIASGVTPPSLHNIFVHVAYERGLFRAHNIDVTEFVQLRGGPLAIQAIASNRVDVTMEPTRRVCWRRSRTVITSALSRRRARGSPTGSRFAKR